MLRVVDNRGFNTALTWFASNIRGAKGVDLAVAFITAKGVDQVLQALQRAGDAGSVRILTGVYEGFTEPGALRTLLREVRRRRHFEVRLSTRDKFHPKLYILRKTNGTLVLAGSSNLTREGLHGEGEFNVSFSYRGRNATNVGNYFEAEWNGAAATLTNAMIGRYERARRTRTPSRLTRPARWVVRAPAEGNVHVAITSSRRFWIDRVLGSASRETNRRIGNTTDWDRRGFGWYVAGENTFRRGDLILLYDHTAATAARLVEVTDSQTLSPPTPDGKHFVAHRPWRKTRAHVVTRPRRAALQKIGTYLGRSNVRRRQVSRARWHATLVALGLPTE